MNERLEQEIIGLFNDDIGGAFSINEIARKLKRAYPYIHKKVTELLHAGILTEVVIGKSHLCSVNLSNDDAILLLSLNESKKKRDLLRKDPRMKTLLHNLEETASNMETGSNIISIVKIRTEIIIIAEGEFSHKIPHAMVMDGEEFKAFYVHDEDARKSHIVLYSFEKYYHLMKDIQGKLRMANLFPKA